MIKRNLYKKLSLFFMLLIPVFGLMAQEGKTCGTKLPAGRPLSVPANYQRNTEDISGMRMVKLNIIITRAEFSGAQPATTEENLFAHLEWMRQQFAPHGICFIIQGISEIVSDDLAYIDADDPADSVLVHSIANINPGTLTVIIHSGIEGNVAGTAWKIPNHCVSLEGDYVWGGFPVIAAHEIGHALGLLHTFETYYGIERVPRSGACVNCSTAGDLICDTEADKDVPDNRFTNCVYTSNGLKDTCNNVIYPYLMTPTNLMSYHWLGLNCAIPYHFTAGQAARAHYTIDNTSFLQNLLLTTNTLTLNTNQNHTSGRWEYVSRNTITVNAASYQVGGTTRLQMSSGDIIIGPGATLSTGGGNGIVVLRANVVCQ